MGKIDVALMQEENVDETYTFQVQKNGEGWLGWIKEIPEVSVVKENKKELLLTLAIEFQNALNNYETQAEIWDKQFEADVKAGKLDRFAEEALADYQAGRCKEI